MKTVGPNTRRSVGYAVVSSRTERGCRHVNHCVGLVHDAVELRDVFAVPVRIEVTENKANWCGTGVVERT